MYDHRSLEAWKSGRSVAMGCFTLARDCWAPWASALFSQLQRAALSVQLNIAEGWSYGQSRTYTRHLTIAYGSSIETGELLNLAAELNLIPEGRLGPMVAENGRSQRLLLGLLKRRRPL